MSNGDGVPCAFCGSWRPVLPPDCVCGHGYAMHDISTNAKRCSVHHGPDGHACTCTGYQEKEDADDD